MHKSLGNRVVRWLLWTVAGIAALVVLIPALLYVPFIQDFAKDIAIKEVKKSTGMDVAVDKLRLRWPLRLSVSGVRVVEATGDTMLTAGRLDVGVKLLPLFKGDIDVNYARLDSTFYQMGNADSLMWLRARIDHAVINPSRLKMNMEDIDLSSAEVDGANIRLIMRPDTVPAPVDTAASNPMVIHAANITLRRVSYTMQMLPTIDSLHCEVPLASLAQGTVDLTNRRIHARSLRIDSVSATYLTPSAQWLKENADYPVAPVDSTVTPPDQIWTITADSLRLTGRQALYAQRGVKPLPGLDMSYLSASNIEIAVDSFYNRGTSITVPLRTLRATERCGLTLDASGTFAMNDSLMQARAFRVTTNNSQATLSATMGTEGFTSPTTPLSLDADASIGLADAVLAFPALRSTISALPVPAMLTLSANAAGTPRSITLRSFTANYPGMLRLNASGTIDNPTDATRMAADITLDGKLTATPAVRRSITRAKLLPGIGLPQVMTVKGNVAYSPMAVNADLKVTADNGRVALKGNWNGNRESYDARLQARDFPVGSFMPTLGVGSLSADLTARGHGYNPLARTTDMHIDADVISVTYNHQPLQDIRLNAHLSGGRAEGSLSSASAPANLAMGFTATTSTDSGYTWNLNGRVNHLDLLALKLMTDTCQGSLSLHTAGTFNPRTGFLDASLSVDSVDWLYGSMPIHTGRTDLSALLSDSLVRADISNGDLIASFTSPTQLDSLLTRFTATGKLVDRQIAARSVDIDSLQRALPPFNLMLDMGANNVAAEFLRSSGTSWNHAALTASNDSLIGFSGAVTGFLTGTTRLDTITINGRQHGHYLVYSAMINNRPGTMDEFAHVTLNGFLGSNRFHALLNQKNIRNEAGYRLGLSAFASDSTVSLRFVPYNPTIAYRRWTINRDNHIDYNLFTHSINADLTLTDSISSLRLFTTAHNHAEHGDSTAALAGLSDEDLVLQLRDIHIQDWLAISPWAPPMKGNVSADMTVHLGGATLTGDGNVSLSDFFYNNERVGNFDVDVNVETDPRSGQLRADMALMVDSIKTITVSGTLNDTLSSSPFLLDFDMIHFPLAVANPFLPQGMAKLSGMLNGKMDISGSMAHPVFNGWLNFDSTAVRVTMLGTDFRFSDEKIPVDSGIVTFNNFSILGCNKNPLSINGTANLRDLANVGLDLALKASDMQILNSSRARNGADAFGKASINLDATVKGNMNVLLVNADMTLLAGSNFTYVMPPTASTISSASAGVDEMVRFVSFNDTTQVAQADSVARSMALVLNAGLTIQEGTTITVDITPDGASKAQIQGSGTLDFSMSPVNDGRLIGRYTINKGMARYNVPMLGEKSFDINEGSYVAFTGNMLDPQLNLSAVDRLKANVTQSGQNSRVITFDIGLNVTGTLENMNVNFDLSTNDDITVQNELQSMSPEQRANQAMNLLLYNTYTGPGTSASSNLSGNPLYSFLESKLNSWMANNVKGVDISFGIDQYDRTRNGNTASTTSYSYQVSKSLFDDRFKIVVGGNYSTDANADENFSQNLISDISFEYMLNRTGSMYVRIFRHTGFESILEGEITQTGAGFVLKRKLNSLADLFRFGRRRRSTPTVQLPANTPATDDNTEK